jgi:hypothetical protein
MPSFSSSRPPQRPSSSGVPPQRPPAMRPVAAGAPNSAVNKANSAASAAAAAVKPAAAGQRITSQAVASKVRVQLERPALSDSRA